MSKNTCEHCGGGYHVNAATAAACAANAVHKSIIASGRGYDRVVKMLEQRDRQLDNQAETIMSQLETINRYAARINELQRLVQAMDETTQSACAVATRAEKNRRNAVEELGRIRGELLEAQSRS